MPKSTLFPPLFALCLAAAGLGAPSALAQEKDASGLPTIPPDIGSDKAELWPPYVLPWLPEGGPVDDRLAHDKTTVTHLFAPTAWILPPGTLVYQNVSLVGQHLHAGLTPTLAVHASLTPAPYTLLGLVAKPASRYSFWATLGGTWQVHKTRDHLVSVWGELVYRDGRDAWAPDEVGGSLGVVFDALVHNRVIVHTALVGHLALRASWQAQDTSRCRSREAFFFEGCAGTAQLAEWVPPGGHWVGASGGVTYVMESLPMALKAQLLTALRTGSVRDLDRLVGPEMGPGDWVSRYAQRRTALGLVQGGGPVSGALGAAYRLGETISVGLSVLYVGEAGGPDPWLDPWWPESTFALEF